MFFLLSLCKNGTIRLRSEYSFEETFERLKSGVLSRGLIVFATINFSDDAEKVGLNMPPTRQLVFGNPKAGTPLMITSPSSAIDFPLRVVVAQDQDGKVWLTYNSPQYLKERHDIPEELLPNIVGISEIVKSAAE